MGLNIRDSRVFDMHRVDIASGEMKLDTKNPGDVWQWYTDTDFQIRAYETRDATDGSTVLKTRSSSDRCRCVYAAMQITPIATIL